MLHYLLITASANNIKPITTIARNTIQKIAVLNVPIDGFDIAKYVHMEPMVINPKPNVAWASLFLVEVFIV